MLEINSLMNKNLDNKDQLIGSVNEEEMKLIIEDKCNEEKKSKDSLLNILQNLERDLILKNNCEKEFDLKNNNNYEEIYNVTKVIGNPTCYICLSNDKKDSTIQLFYCSHCKKLICNKCISFHYNSNFSNIEDSYNKYVKKGNNDINEIKNKNLPLKLGLCKMIIFVLCMVLIGSIYLIPIFSMKVIKSGLETIIMNCFKNVLAYKIEKPDSLFNFYEIFFDNVQILTFNFDLMMIMNWLGDNFLQSCGYIVTGIIFISINFLQFILIFQFNFLDYNQNNKYSLWKFLHLLSIYILNFIGLGGSSLLSQKIFVELFNKFNERIERMDDFKEKIENAIKIIKDEKIELKDKKDKDNDNDKKDYNYELKEEENYNDLKTVNNLERKTLRDKRIKTEKLKSDKNFKTFFFITTFTLTAYLADYFFNSEIIRIKNETDKKIQNNIYIKYNISLNISMDVEEKKNTNITNEIYKEIYDNDKNYFFNIYSSYYSLALLITIILYSIAIYSSFQKENKKNEVKEYLDSLKKEKSGEDFNNNKSTLLKLVEAFENKKNPDDSKDIKDINEKNSNNINYRLCKFCGFLYYSETNDLRGDMGCCKKFCNCLGDFFKLNFKSFIDCFNVTFCNIINIIFCYGKDICKCKCFCDSNKIEYNKISESFCFFFKEKRKYKWFHDYITSEIQKEIFKYLLEYFYLGLTVIALDKQFIDFRYKARKGKNIYDKGFSFKEGLKNLQNTKILIIIIISLYLFFKFSSSFGKKTIKKSKIQIEKTDFSYFTVSILKGIHILLLINSIISVIFSIIYFYGIKDFDDYIILPILMYKCFYLIFNYYCICLSGLHSGNEFIFSGSVLISIYMIIWNFIYSLIQKFDDLYLFIFQTVFSFITILVYIYYLVFSNSKFKYSICENCINCNLCGACENYCRCNIFCIEGSQYCDCCFCDDTSCFYCKFCEHFFVCNCCKCLSENADLIDDDDDLIKN